MTKEKDKEKNETEILFPEAKVGDITIVPWSFGTLFDISDLLDEVITKIEEKGIAIETEFISYVTMAKIFTLASSQVLKIMSITLSKPQKDIKALPMEDGIKIAAIIARQNWTVLKNVVSEILKVEETKPQKDLQKEQEEETK